jgi:hypothetical protein
LVPVPIFLVGFRSTGFALTGVSNPLRPSQATTPSRPSQHDGGAASEPTHGNPEPPVRAAHPADEMTQTEHRPAPTGQSDSIDLIIDKLPHHMLVKPIPVTIAPLGDRVFIASTPDLDITVTGNSLSDALLLLKQQLESTYDSLRGKPTTREQERQMKRLRDYIRDN